MLKVLIADDSLMMRRTIKLLFEGLGHNIAGEISDGSQIVNEYEKCRPDLVTLDIMMDSISGIDALKMLKEKYPDAKVIIISSKGNRENILEAIQAGASSFIVKPIDKKRLIETIESIFGKEKIIADNKEDQETASSEESQSKKEEAEETIEIYIKDNILEYNFKKIIDSDTIGLLEKQIKSFDLIKNLKIRFNMQDTEFDSKSTERSFKLIIKEIRYKHGNSSILE